MNNQIMEYKMKKLFLTIIVLSGLIGMQTYAAQQKRLVDHQAMQKYGYPLFEAIEKDNIKDVSYYIQKMDDERYMYISSLRNKGGLTPLFFAIEKGKLEITELLINKGFPVNTKAGPYPIHKAIENNQLDIVKLLLERGGR